MIIDNKPCSGGPVS